MRARIAVPLTAVVCLAAAAPPAGAAVPGLNGRISFSSEGDLWSARSDGTGVRQLTRTARDEAQSSFSPDGRRIAFRARPADGQPLQIYVMDADGGGVRRVTSGSINESQPSWSPDGTSIVYRRTTRGGSDGDVWVIGADGSDARALVSTPDADERYPSFSPDGTRLAFTSDAAGQFDVYVASARGGSPRRLTADPASDSSPSWSPDGTALAFERGGDGADERSKDVWSMTATGGSQRRLTSTPGVDEGPSFSPDGRWIAFTSGRGGTTDIFRMRVDGSRQQPVVRRAADEESPDWQALRSPATVVPAILERLGDAVQALLGGLLRR